VICLIKRHSSKWKIIKYSESTLNTCILPSLIEVVGPIMDLISGTHHFYEKMEYAFNVLPEYSIITMVLPNVNNIKASLNSIISCKLDFVCIIVKNGS
jgi:hypothetical protein